MRKFRSKISQSMIGRLAGDRKGAVLPLFGIMVILMIAIGGIAVDVSRSVNGREKLSYALDAAALSVAADLSTSVMTDDEIREALTDSFKANLNNAEFLDEAIENLNFTVDADNGLITVNSTATLNNYFIDIGGYMKEHLGPETFAFGTTSQVAYSRFDVELALVVDVTGSMWSDMDTLRDASEGLVDILIPVDTSVDDSKVRIALVPYSQGVNLADYADQVKGDAYGYSDGSECVTERQDYDDGSSLFEVKYTDDPYDYYEDSTPPPAQTFYGGGSNSCSSSSEMIPLSSDRDTLVDAIENLTATGGTASQTGITWGWNSLSQNYSDVWPSDSTPEDYENEEVLKFAIIMTDGNNNRYYEFVETERRRVCTGWRWSRTCRWQDVEVNDWDEVSESESYSNESSTASRELCEGMKDAGIEVYGVYFGSSNSSAGALNMQSCASDGNYYQASSSSDLINAFANIAKKIQQIYISK
jgi:Flp pilus assembly protein TadG